MFRKFLYWGLLLWAGFVSYSTLLLLAHGSLFTSLNNIFTASNAWLNKPFVLAFQVVYLSSQPILGLLVIILFSWRLFSFAASREVFPQPIPGLAYLMALVPVVLVGTLFIFASFGYLFKSSFFLFGGSLLLPWVLMIAPILATLSFVVCEANIRLASRKIVHGA